MDGLYSICVDGAEFGDSSLSSLKELFEGRGWPRTGTLLVLVTVNSEQDVCGDGSRFVLSSQRPLPFKRSLSRTLEHRTDQEDG